MVFVQSGIGFWVAVALYLTVVPAALLLRKSPRAANLATQLLCMGAALSGFASSLMHLLLAPGRTVLADFTGTVPLLALRIVLDDLSAFFLLALSVLVFAVSLFSISYLEPYAGKRNLPLFDVLYALFALSMVLVFTSGHAVTLLPGMAIPADGSPSGIVNPMATRAGKPSSWAIRARADANCSSLPTMKGLASPTLSIEAMRAELWPPSDFGSSGLPLLK